VHAIRSIQSVTLGVASLERAARFYTEVWGLTIAGREGGMIYLRASGPAPYVLALSEAPRRELIDVAFDCGSDGVLNEVHRSLKSAGLEIVSLPHRLRSPGGGQGLSFRDAEGRTFSLVAGAAPGRPDSPVPDRPVKLAHVVLNAMDAERSSDLFLRRLGFRLSDQTGMIHFLRCNADHHSIAFARTGNTSVNHIAFEMPSWDGLMRGAGRVKQAGHALEWGLGRHGPGRNVFAYFLDPDEFAIEYTTEVQQIDEATHRAGTPADWHRPGNLDAWGFADPPSERIRRAMHGDAAR